MEFRDWFCLRDRETFTIDAKINPGDARFYFGREAIEKRIKSQMRRAFLDPGVPKMIIYGPYGSGKTQTLYHLEHYLQTDKPRACRLEPRTIHLDLEMYSKADHYSWHLQLMEHVGKDTVVGWVESLSKLGPDFETELHKVFEDPNLVAAGYKLTRKDTSFAAWQWLSGQQLRASDLETLEVTRNLGQTGAGDLVSTLVSVGRLAEANGEALIFLMDEAEQFRNVRTADAIESLHDYLRKLSEPANAYVGFIIASYALSLDDMPELLIRPDIRGRIGELNVVEIPPLPTVEVKVFTRELLAELVDTERAEAKIQEGNLGVSIETYPFTSDAFDMLCEYASQDPIKALPRNIIKTINECAISAWDEDKPIVNVDIVNEVAPLIFG
jgi:hypothetical protein